MEVFRIPHFDLDVYYLIRWRIIQTPWFAIYLHKINTPDSRPTLHDHPWSFIAFVLKGGGYWEKRLDKSTLEVVDRRVRRINIMRREDYHYIKSIPSGKSVWTLLLVGARRQTWGYLRPTVTTGWIWTPFDKDVHSLSYDKAAERMDRHG